MNGDGARRNPGRFWARRWHRWLGVVFGIPLLWLTVSGLVLRHADWLGLHEARVKSGWLLRQYGMIPEGRARGCEIAGRQVSEWGESLFLNGKVLEESGVLVGAIARGDDAVVATEDYLLVYDGTGGLVDQLGEESLPVVPLKSIGIDANKALVVRGDGRTWRIADDFLTHDEAEEATMKWSVVADLPREEQDALERGLAEQAGISAYRVWLDLHSGNLFGWIGKLTVDLSGVAIIVLSIMGFRLVFRRPSGRA